MSQLENTKTPLELRTELHKMVVADLLGPSGGADEIVDEQSVRSRYVVGLLAPKKGQSIIPPDEQDEELALAGTDTQDGKPASPIAPVPAMLPSSIGLTFSVSTQAKAIQVIARWGHYRRTRSEVLKDDKGEPKLIWQRQQIEAESEPMLLKPGKIKPWSPSKDFPDVIVSGLMRKYEGTWTITLFLVNEQQEPKTQKDEAWVFQPELIVRDPEGQAIFTRRAISAKIKEEP